MVFALLTLFLYRLWLPWIGEFLVVADPLQKADALAILAGDENERIAAGAQLFKQGYASWFVLTDMRLDLPNSQGVYSANVKRKAVEQGVPAERILVAPGQVSTTEEEAIRLKEFIVSQGFRSLIVVTSPYHTRRARMLLREAFCGSGVTLIVRPALNYNYQAETWWQNPVDRQETYLEYAKILGHLLGCRAYGDCGPLPWEWLKTLPKDVPTG
jgi:uncharacterized SAM-binding protein YcdF (DUF218 family)